MHWLEQAIVLLLLFYMSIKMRIEVHDNGRLTCMHCISSCHLVSSPPIAGSLILTDTNL